LNAVGSIRARHRGGPQYAGDRESHTIRPNGHAQTTPGPGTATPTPEGLPSDVPSLVALAQESYDRAQSFLKAGDFAGYGNEISRLKSILARLQQVAGTPVAGR